MKTTRYSSSRQKACQPCSNAKAKCDRKTEICSRCATRGLSCVYPSSTPVVAQNTTNTGGKPEINVQPQPSISKNISIDTILPDLSSTASVCSLPQDANVANPGNSPLDFSNLELVCPINADDINMRWMRSYIPLPEQIPKAYSTATVTFIRRVLKSYSAVAVRSRGIPPFIHPLQMTVKSASPLATCLSLVRICDNLLPGSDEAVAGVLMREMQYLYMQRTTYDDMTLLSAFQAYLIYSMVLFFQLGRVTDSFLRQAVIALQELACSSSRQGLLCVAEQLPTRPKWEAWIVTEAKRRSLYTMYLFDSVLSAQDGLPVYLGTELRGLFAPGSKTLWHAQSRQDWETVYNRHLVDWAGKGFQIDELWPITAALDDAEVVQRRTRMDRWLENLDEFGVMIYAVTSSTHGD
ncbi:hypothetical protein TWF102_010459 [Orbilia oligospora]|uniref:Zn(2)-C6 fungal-type domain-containing protein n=1 Tax=Orbilia oligospora TaxID=2813651 RepID=A0A7C8J4S8_ORBOL|nr:hypothetical protein TWF102_010459 [Orbilia oligospora]KAF3117544.1 hypothetical protein TWF103_006274 [Orbilia oligospora]